MPRIYWWESYKDSLISELITKESRLAKIEKERGKLAEEIEKLKEDIDKEGGESKNIEEWLDKLKSDFSNYIEYSTGDLANFFYLFWSKVVKMAKKFDKEEVKNGLNGILDEIKPADDADDAKERFNKIKKDLENRWLIDKEISETGTLKFKPVSMISVDEKDNRNIELECGEDIQISGFTFNGVASKKLRMWFNIEVVDTQIDGEEDKYNELKTFFNDNFGEEITIDIIKSSSINREGEIIDIYYPKTFQAVSK